MQSSTNVPYPAYFAPPKVNSNTGSFLDPHQQQQQQRSQSPMPMPPFAGSHSPSTATAASIAVPRRNPQAYYSAPDREKSLLQHGLDHVEQRAATDYAPPAYHDAKLNGQQQSGAGAGVYTAYNPYPSPPAVVGPIMYHSPSSSPSYGSQQQQQQQQQQQLATSPSTQHAYQTHPLPIAQQFTSQLSSSFTYSASPSSPPAFFSAAAAPSYTSQPIAVPLQSQQHHRHHYPPQHHSHYMHDMHPAQQQQKHAPSHLPPPPREPLPPPPPLSELGFPQSYSYTAAAAANTAATAVDYTQQLSSQQQQHQSYSVPLSTSSPSPQHRYYSQPYQYPSSFSSVSQQYAPASPSTSVGAASSFHSMHSSHSPQALNNTTQNIDNTVFSLHTSLSSLSLAPSIASVGNHLELTRVASNGSGSSSAQRPASIASKSTAPVMKTVMDIKTAEVLSSLTFEDMPRCYVVAPPSVPTSSTGAFTPFRILAPCQALGVRDGKDASVHFPEHQGYAINNPEQIMKKHGTVLQHLANLACLVSGATDTVTGKGLVKHAEKFLRNVKPTTRVPALRDTIDISTGVDGTSLQIEKFMTEHLQLESIAQLMRDITGSHLASDWSGGLQRMISPGTGRSMWVCQDCFTGLQSGRYEWNDEQASLDDLIGYPDKSGVKSEAHLLNAVAVETYSQMIRGQSRIKNAVVHISPVYFELPERRAAAVFLANQKLVQNLTKVLSEAHLTMVELNANQARDSELMDKDNIYLHVRRLFSCFQLEYVKLSGLPFLLREKLPGFLNHAKFLSFDGVLVDNDKAVTNMKKLITENSDMENLTLTRAQMTSTGLKILCTAHKNLRRLTRLDLSKNRLDAEGIKDLSSHVLPTSLDLRFLDLSDNPKIGTTGCLSLLNAIWPASSHATKQKNLISLQLANTGFCDEAAKMLSRNIENPNGIGALYNINVSSNQITKPGLLAIMTCVSQNASTSTLRKLSLSQHVSALSIPGAMDYEAVHFFGVHPTLTHLSLSKLSLGTVAQIVNLNKSLVSLTVDDVMCVSPQDPNYALSSFNSLCQSIMTNSTMQDLKIRLQWSFWTLAFQSTSNGSGGSGSSSEQESNWINAAGWMAVMENSLQRNTVLRCFQMRGVTNFEEELVLASAMAPPSAALLSGAASISAGSAGRYGGMGAMNGNIGSAGGAAGEIASTEGENKMIGLSQNLRMYLERNQVLHYGRKHGLEAQLVSQY